MKNTLAFIFFMGTIFFISCKLNQKINYCEILNTDQSNLPSPTLSLEENEKLKQKRKQIFLNNYQKIRADAKKNGLPTMDKELEQSDTCKYYGILATFIHISQTRPDIFYGSDNVDFIYSEILANHLTANFLYTPVKLGTFNTVCDSIMPKIEFAIRKWGVNEALLKEFKYKTCS